MYGGVATPLALLHHGEMNGRTKQHNSFQKRSNCREDSFNGTRNAPRLPPLRETNHQDRDRDVGNIGCENDPLLPTVAPKPLRNGKKFSLEENLPVPPLPPHKNHYQQVQRQYSHPNDMKYMPPWPQGQSPYSVVPRNGADNIKPYLKPLPKPPGKESPNRHHRKQINGPAPPPHHVVMALPHQRTPERTPEILRNKLQNRNSPLHSRRSPLHNRNSPHHNRHSPLQRHYSDESIGGLYATGAPQRIHSSADEISSLNHSPSISSSDESYSRTTDADVSPCVSPPLPAEPQQFLFPSDIQVNPCSSPEVSPRASLDYIPPNCSLRNNSTERSSKRNNLPPTALIALAGNANTLDSTIITSPPVLDGEESGRGESCASFEFIGRTKQKPNPLTKAYSANGAVSRPHAHKQQRSSEKRTRNDSDSILECNKLSANCKRSPSFKEAEEIKELLKEKGDILNKYGSEKSKRDGCSQTDKKDMRRMHSSPSGHREKHSPNTKLNNTEESTENIAGPFEREIQKLLEEQNLLQNIPPKHELTPQNKDLALEPLVRYAPNNNTHQVGLAAIQALALGLRVNPTGSVTLQCISPTRASSKEGSLKRGASPGPSECHKQQKVSPLDRYIIIIKMKTSA